MSKFEQLRQAIEAIPDEYNVIRNVMLNLLEESGHIQDLRAYSLGALDMARHLTSEENLLESLRLVRGLLK